MFVDMQACRVVGDKEELVAAIADLLANPDDASELGQNGLTLLKQNKGALARLLVLLEPLLSEPSRG
jgi:3-deoxy-D-manno-octulosonic-acid transferase